MSWKGFLKGVFITVALSASVWALWYGSFYLLLGRPWMRLVGLGMVAAAFRTVILCFDLMWGRPQVWSKDPMERAAARNPENYRHH